MNYTIKECVKTIVSYHIHFFSIPTFSLDGGMHTGTGLHSGVELMILDFKKQDWH